MISPGHSIGRRSGGTLGPRGGRVTDGLVLLAAWLEFLALLTVLGYLLLRRRG